MKIGITTFGGDLKSGMSRYVSSLLEQFAANPGKEQFEVLTHASARAEYLGGIETVTTLSIGEWLRNPLLNIIWHQIGLPMVSYRRQFDVIFLPAASRRMPLWAPCPMVGTVHDLTPFHVRGKYDPARMLYQTRVLPRLLKNLDHVIAISESTKRDIMKFAGVPGERITVIHHGADTTRFYPKDRLLAAEQLRPYGIRTPYVVYVSRIEHPGKNHVRLIRAFERLKTQEAIPHQLVLAGADWTRAEEVHCAAAESLARDDILFTGYVPGNQLLDLYCGSDAMVFPSLFEGFGLPILEAMACGVPVACSNVSSMPEIAGDAAALFDPLDVDSISRNLLALLASKQMRATYRRMGLARARRFSWAKTAEKTLDVIRGAVRYRAEGRRGS